jgi:signal transduction histidine kinase
MIAATLAKAMDAYPLVGGTDGEFGNAKDLGHILLELGACRWSGTLTPLCGYVKSPVPDQLSEFARGGNNWFECVFPADLERVHKNVASMSRGEPSLSFEYRMVNEKAGIVWVRHWWSKDSRSPAARLDGKIEGFVQIIDERKELEAECVRASELERHQIGQELHDDVCQILAGLACMLELFGREVKTAIPAMTPTVNELVSQLNGGMERTRTLAHCLVPLRLIALGLPAALAELAKQAHTCWGLTVKIVFSRNLFPHQPDQTLHLYRIAQEAISNAVKHGKATKIRLNFRRSGTGTILTIQDNGCGLSSTIAQKDGLGLNIMHYRAVEIGGDFSISSPPTGGTIVTVNYPNIVFPALK